MQHISNAKSTLIWLTYFLSERLPNMFMQFPRPVFGLRSTVYGPHSSVCCLQSLVSRLRGLWLVLSNDFIYAMGAHVCDNWIIYFRGLAASELWSSWKIVEFSLSIKSTQRRRPLHEALNFRNTRNRCEINILQILSN